MTLQLTKRGSRKQYRTAISATVLAGGPSTRRSGSTILVNDVAA
nr:hypothetical protein [Rhodanobacter glycinis]